MPDTLTKPQQEAEAFARAQQRGTAQPDPVSPVVADTAAPEDAAPAPAPAAAAPAPETPEDRPAPQGRPDDRRAAIVARFRRDRDTPSDTTSDAEEIRAFAHNGLPPELVTKPAEQIAAEAPEPEVPVVEEAPPLVPAAPTKRKVVVRGKEHELTDDELVAAAQRGMAGDDYLDEGKRKLGEINELYRKATLAASTSPAAIHPGAPHNGQTAEPAPTPADGSEHPENPLSKVVEQIQFGDPAQAATLLAQTIDEQVTRRSAETIRNERVRNESVRSARFLKEFEGQHSDIAHDEFATAAMEKHLYNLQREDLVKLATDAGHDVSQIPTDARTVANWHLYYRTEGHPVRDVPALLKTARDNFLAWKGTPKDEPKPAATPAAASPRIEVAVDRAVRRAAIPQQPTRTVTPKPDAAQPAPARDRSAVVRDMIAMRAKPRGRVVGV